MKKIKERISLLLNNPELGKKTDFYNTRALSLAHYSILYQNIGSKIVITAFWDNRQDPEKLLKLLIKK
jgi:plasmid stabilization system protein ParE